MELPSPIANSSIQLWLDFNGTIPTIIPPCQQRANDYGFMNSPNVTFQNCTNICNNGFALFDPVLPNNLPVCGLWASIVGSEESFGPYIDNEDLAPFISLSLDHKNVTYVRYVQDIIYKFMAVMVATAAFGTSRDTPVVPMTCSRDLLFAKNSSVSRYAAP